ncbi:tautomerase family protein [Paenibacillus polysaccharolyticus]|uniref:Tautomerase enzyme n=2 Tax=Paenibacillus TaxID=44249 RepID=A0A1G5D2X8_9BACL|nr:MULTISPECIES: tautomerase family protein [Paenibacillus]MBY0203281.1 tautomerase family protein [Paenibacillus cucumis (ex Kampfer et al. 2016)]MCP1133771.1 tautomerase family protein [Paenibacillus polysaccharolyticus]SCY08994.1 Tautomerase enzyme [Paenibacillus polysaccharolyticus]
MPLTRIVALKGRSNEEKTQLKEVVLQTIVDKLHVPANDRFLIIEELDRENFSFDPTCLDIERSEGFLIIQVTLNLGRPDEMKKEFYEALAEELHQKVGIRKEDVFINLIEVTKENWSYGNGIASFIV